MLILSITLQTIMNKRTNWIVGISDGKAHEYKIGNVTFTVFSEFEPMKSENTIKSRFEKSITSDFTDLTGEIFEDTMAAEYVCSTAGKEDLCSRKRKTNKQG